MDSFNHLPRVAGSVLDVGSVGLHDQRVAGMSGP